MKRTIKKIIAFILITTVVSGAANFPLSAEELFGLGKENKLDELNPGLKDCANGMVHEDTNDLKVTYNREPEKPEPHLEPVSDDRDKKDKTVNKLYPREKSEIIVKYKELSKLTEKKDGLKKKLKLSKFNIKKRIKDIEVIEIGENDSSEELLKELHADSNVEYAQLNYKLYTNGIPNDKMFSSQWELYNTAQVIGGQEGIKGVDINIIPAWDITKGSKDVIVGVLDTGIDINNNEIKDAIYINQKEIPGNGIDDDNNNYIDDVNGYDFANNDNKVYDSETMDLHGTFIAGQIAAKSNNTGIAGVSNVKILPLKFINGEVGYTSDAIEAIEYAKKMGVKIINCSWGSTFYNQALKDKMADSGILFICSAGNNSMDVAQTQIYPACFDLDNKISVAAIDNRGNLASFSNYGKEIDVAAPGVSIYGIAPVNNYLTMNGTSFSAALVTGVAALIRSKYPEATNRKIISRIKNNVVTSTNLEDKVASGGRIDAYAALTDNKPQPDKNDSLRNDPVQTILTDNINTTMSDSNLLEKIHYGENGVNPATGNFSRTFIDMSLDTPGFELNISRTYNSKSNTVGKFGRGWTFGFDGSVRESTGAIKEITVILPNGGVQTFTGYSDGINFRANDSRSILKKISGKYVLTTKDQYTYTFNTVDSTTHIGYLSQMKDKNGNCIDIEVDNTGKITKITDSATGRFFDVVNTSYTINGKIYNFISSVKQKKATGEIVRSVDYIYTNNILTGFKDPSGNNYNYEYTSYTDRIDGSSQSYLTKISDPSNSFESILYNISGTDQNKVKTFTDKFKNTFTFTYDSANRTTTITDSNNRVTIKKYDEYYNVTKSTDPEGNVTTVDYQNEKWTIKAYRGEATGTSAVSVDGKIYIVGGIIDGNVEEYNPLNNTWEKKSSMGVARTDICLAVVKGKIYAIGGYNSEIGVVNTIEEYDPVTDRWTFKGGMKKGSNGTWTDDGYGMPTKRSSAAVAVLNDKIFVIGGSNGNELDKVEAYDPAAPLGSAWKTMKQLPSPRSALSAATVNGKIYAIGGTNSNKTTEFTPDGSIGLWVEKAGMSTITALPGVCEINGKIYAIGGHNSGGITYNKTEEYDPIYNTWSLKAPMKTIRCGPATVALNGKAYVIGGAQQSVYVNIVEEYQPNAANYGGELAVSIEKPSNTTPLSENSPIVFGLYHSVFLNSDGEIYVSGYNSKGQLGLGDNQTRTVRQVVGGIKDVKQVVVGGESTYLLMNDSTVKAFGRNTYGQIV